MKRTRSPEETISILETYVHKSLITRIADLTFLDNISSLIVFSAIRPSAKSISVSMGKSLDPLSAKCGAMAESFETYVAEEVIAKLVDVPFSDFSKEKRIIKNKKNSYRCKFANDFPLNWNIGFEVDTNEEAYIPLYLLSLDTNNLINQYWGSNSDGIASGNSLEEALVVSLLEQIERIAVKDDRKHILKFDKEILDNYHLSQEYNFKFYQYENIFNVPVVGVEVYNKSRYANQCVYCGFGAASSYENALCRALEEALQTKVGVISGARDDLKQDYYQLNNTVTSIDNFDERDGIYPELSYGDNQDLLQQLKLLISKLGHRIFYFEYFNDNFFVVKTFIIDSENNIL